MTADVFARTVAPAPAARHQSPINAAPPRDPDARRARWCWPRSSRRWRWASAPVRPSRRIGPRQAALGQRWPVIWPLLLWQRQTTATTILGQGAEEYRRVLVASAWTVMLVAAVAYFIEHPARPLVPARRHGSSALPPAAGRAAPDAPAPAPVDGQGPAPAPGVRDRGTQPRAGDHGQIDGKDSRYPAVWWWHLQRRRRPGPEHDHRAGAGGGRRHHPLRPSGHRGHAVDPPAGLGDGGAATSPCW